MAKRELSAELSAEFKATLEKTKLINLMYFEHDLFAPDLPHQ